MMVLAVTSFVPAKPFRPHAFRVYRRRRLKISASFPPSPAPFENLFHSLIAQYPSVNSLEFITPALGFASGAALFFSRFKSTDNSSSLSDIGEWILFASPTPFNRFVLLRCPSISFEGSDDVGERLVREERHRVSVNSGRIRVRGRERERDDLELSYQRVCVSAKDGGVVSFDWPANLDLEEERGLDTTLLLVPGTPQGSMDASVRLFVVEALRRGFFPVVMNPRGCAASPLVTPRLFTAADSDDICTAITYINNARPWTTLMGVGWGYGANMLTKYLAEVGERTPLTAATCIDNPFDLDEATRSSPYHIVTDQKLTGGLIDILQTNKALFQGKTKGFDVEKALLAKSVRDFEEAISMVSYGFGAIEDFYSKSSTRNMITDVKIPVLFIQSDNGMVPVFSVPRNLIAENPFTSLLLCSCFPSSVIDTDMSALSWCQLLTIEWLTAVELGLLKGRHPLLTDIDVTINPAKGLAAVEEEVRSNKDAKVGTLLDLTRSQQGLQQNFEQDDMSLQVKDGPLQHTSSSDADLIEEENVVSVDSEHGQVPQTAQVVINMLDVTMPGTLTEERKKKVLAAVGQGETLMKALQDAVPEDVRGKLTDAVTGILHARGSELKVDRILNISEPLSGQKNQEKFRVSGAEVMVEDQPSVNQMKKTSSPIDGSDNAPGSIGELAEGTETEVIPMEKSPNSTAESQESNDEVGSSSSFRKETDESNDNNDTNEESKGKAVPGIDHSKNGLETGSKPYTPNHPDGAGGFESAVVGEQKSQNSGIAQTGSKEENNILKDEQKSQDFSSDQSKNTSTDAKEEPSSSSVSAEHQAIEREGNDNEKKDNKNTQHISHQTNSNNLDSSAPAFSVSQALDALAGMDDSTQVAVNSVFGVIENMLSQLEQNTENEEVRDGKVVEHKIEEKQKTNSQRKDSNTSDDPSVDDHHNDMYLSNGSCHTEEQPAQSLSEINGNGVFNSQSCNSNDHLVQNESNTNSQLIDKRFLIDKWDGHKHVNRMPEFIAAGSYGVSPHNENLHKYLVSKIPTKPLDLDTTTELLLDYFPEEGQWKLFEQPQNMEIASSNTETCEETGHQMKSPSSAKSSNAEQYIEPPYVILDTEQQQEPIKEFITTDSENRMTDTSDDRSDDLIQFVKKRVLNSLKMEVGPKLNAAEMIEMKSKLAEDLEHVANAISQAVVHSKVQQLYTESQGHNVESAIEKVGTLEGGHIISVISSSVQQTNCLRKVMPVGVIVGSILVSLRKYFNVTTLQDDQRRYLIHNDEEKPSKKNYGIGGATEIDQVPEKKTSLDHFIQTEAVESESKDTSKNTVMVGAVTAALGASALLMQQKDPEQENGTAESSSTSLKMKDRHQKEPERLQEVSEKNQNNIVTSLAEKAMSVAGPVVPTKEDGEVDQERLVAMLADLGQRGGLLRLVGKIALLWGGIRGAMSLTDRLISFLRIAECPLLQRIFGFVGMILVLWSPVAIPLLPTIVQSWTTKTSSKIAEFACIVGLYTAIVILVMLWGKRIRGYENAFEQYGLDLTSPQKLFEFLKGLVGGVIFIFSIHAVNAFIGCASFSWPHMPTSLDAITWLKVYGQMGLVIVQGTVMASAIALVEELLFRSWLPQEIAVDLGYHHGIIISGLAFSFLQRSLQAIPGLWLLSLSLSGARQRNGGSLFIPIGLRTGMMASTFMLQKGGLLTYHNKDNFPLWIIGHHPFQPFSGLVGLVFSLSLAILLYPRQISQRKEAQE
ncbi:Embryogenesis-associated protein EMB8 [Spatholobus suberectus]|nr:Embryogenesis-associated protein EMB8 [Spatholobus suberectus]